MPASRYDVIVVGAGHAGIEAAAAAARLGADALLVTGSLDSIGLMSCNPAIGGIGKGQLVRELDALGGEMGVLTDRAGIHFRRLNMSKGRAVRSSRVQVDRQEYRQLARRAVEHIPGLSLLQAMVTGILTRGRTAVGVETSLGRRLRAKTVILAPGTFLNGRVHVGEQNHGAGRMDEAPAVRLARDLRRLGLKLGRFKTGTPPRLDFRSLDPSRMQEQQGDEPPTPISFWTTRRLRNRASCWMTYTNPRTHRIIRSGLKRSPLYSGRIKGTGVRYCPSVEDKVVRFSDRTRHLVFIEPEGTDTVECYPNGVSTSLPVALQEKMLRSIPGLEDCRMLRPGYAIEHDFVHPTQLLPTLETRAVNRLFLAGQVNGTTGYEEAGAQGLLAGVNAARRAQGKGSFTLGRADAYIGVMIDDLITRGTDEPYRMFTSRVEHRLLLREDNADIRLSRAGHELGLLPDSRYRKVRTRRRQLDAAHDWLRHARVRPTAANNRRLRQLATAPVGQATPALDLLKRPEVSWDDVAGLSDSAPELTPALRELVEVEVKYAGYIERSRRHLERFRELERIRLPRQLDYRNVPGLSTEIREKLTKLRPDTLARAQSIPGMTPAATFALLVRLKGTG